MSKASSPSSRYSTLLRRFSGNADWERALDTSRQWLAEDPEAAAAHLGAGQALVCLGKHARARRHLEKALQANPRNGFAHRLMSITYFQDEAPALAEQHIQQAIELQPLDAMHWFHLAWMRYRVEALEAAAVHARRALELQPRNAKILNLLSVCETKPELKRERCLEALEIDPENSDAHNNLGIYHLEKKEYQKAENCFRNSLTIDPTAKGTQNNLLLTLRERDWFYRLLCSPRRAIAWGRTRTSNSNP